MAEKEPHQEEAPEIAFVKPIEISISADGSQSTLLKITSPNKGFGEKVTRYLEDVFDGKAKRVNSSSSSTFGFGGTKWTALWNPKRSKPNWAEPENPSKN